MINPHVLDYPCTFCGAARGDACFSKSGRATDPHTVRVRNSIGDYQGVVAGIKSPIIDAAAKEIAEGALSFPPRKPQKVAKGKYKVRCHSHVWCDHHTSLHEATIDVYDESGYRLDGTPSECNPDNWRRVYVATDDKDETF